MQARVSRRDFFLSIGDWPTVQPWFMISEMKMRIALMDIDKMDISACRVRARTSCDLRPVNRELFYEFISSI